ncbi:MAG: hypothetical protein QOG56_2894, partial [Solirubrobacteraceae bacterium]|nr:hypothetical protein [Solirubrobacteraceae bacterium]
MLSRLAHVIAEHPRRFLLGSIA